MVFNTNEIIDRINLEFRNVYKPFTNFPDSGVIWDECIIAVSDVTLMNHIIFCNDIMGIPPVKVFLAANNILQGGFSDEQKKAIGAFWGFVFKFVFMYSGQKDSVPVNVKGVKKAALFLTEVKLSASVK